MIFGAPCTGKTTLVTKLRELGVKVADMDELMFEKYRKPFEDLDYDIEAFVNSDNLRLQTMISEWNAMCEGAECYMVWPSWLQWFSAHAVEAIGLAWHDDEKWWSCLNNERKTSRLAKLFKGTKSIDWVLDVASKVEPYVGFTMFMDAPAAVSYVSEAFK
jgi:hypothetical protein